MCCIYFTFAYAPSKKGFIFLSPFYFRSERFTQMSKKGRNHNTKQYLKHFENMAASELLDDEEKLEKYDEMESQYDDDDQMERIHSNIRKKLKNGNY